MGGFCGSGFGVVAGFFGGVGLVWGWICGLVWGRVLFSESPPLMRKDCGQPPFFEQPGIWFAFERAGFGWGRVSGACYRGNADLQSFGGSGKFGKLLRSDS